MSRFPIGFNFVKGFLTYEVIAYNAEFNKPYRVRVGYSSNETDSEEVEMTEGELALASSI